MRFKLAISVNIYASFKLMAQFSFASALKVEVLITTQRQQSVNVSKEKQQKRANL